MDSGKAYNLGAGRKYEGRPMVWETREVREETNHNWFDSLYLPSPLPTNLENMLEHTPISPTGGPPHLQ
jgi:hypothetical protein